MACSCGSEMGHNSGCSLDKRVRESEENTYQREYPLLSEAPYQTSSSNYVIKYVTEIGYNKYDKRKSFSNNSNYN